MNVLGPSTNTVQLEGAQSDEVLGDDVGETRQRAQSEGLAASDASASNCVVQCEERGVVAFISSTAEVRIHCSCIVACLRRILDYLSG